MSSSSLTPLVIPSPRSPRSRATIQIIVTPPPTPSPRHVAQVDKLMLDTIFHQWKMGEFDTDEVVRRLLPESTKGKAYAAEVYRRFVEEIRVEPNRGVLSRSRGSLYAASVFSRYADCVEQFNEIDKAFIAGENAIRKSNPDIFGKL